MHVVFGEELPFELSFDSFLPDFVHISLLFQCKIKPLVKYVVFLICFHVLIWIDVSR